MATVEQVNQRLEQIAIDISKYQQALNQLVGEQQQWIGYRQALLEIAPKNEETTFNDPVLLNENEENR